MSCGGINNIAAPRLGEIGGVSPPRVAPAVNYDVAAPRLY